MSKAKEEKSKKSINDLIKKLPQYIPEVIPTQIPVIDTALCGGLELGNVIQIVGESAVGKSTVAIDIALHLCNMDYKVLYVDTEGSISKELINNFELSESVTENLIYVRACTFEQIESLLDEFISTDEIKFIFVDSLAGIIHQGFVNIDGKKSISITTDNTSYNSKKLVNFMNKYNALAKMKNICFIIINQNRNQIDMKQQGTILKIYGCKNVLYNSDVILRIKTSKSDSHLKKITSSFQHGIALQLEVLKSNKREPTEIPFYLLYGRGISTIISDLYALIQIGIIKEDGNGYYSTAKFKAHGINELYSFYQKFLMEDEDVQNSLKNYYDKI